MTSIKQIMDMDKGLDRDAALSLAWWCQKQVKKQSPGAVALLLRTLATHIEMEEMRKEYEAEPETLVDPFDLSWLKRQAS